MKIAWCDKTVQVTVGCEKCSAGCANCYAERMAARMACMAPVARAAGRSAHRLAQYAEVVGQPVTGGPVRWNGRVLTRGEDGLADLRVGGKPKRIFVNSMADLFHPAVPRGYIADVFAEMGRHREHTYLVLTKRAERAYHFGRAWGLTRPVVPPNVLVGYSIEDQAAFIERAAVGECYAVQWISAEPLIGPIDLFATTCTGFKVQDWLLWLVIGCETGPGRRPCNLEWVHDLIRQADELAIPVFVKQLEIGGRVSHNPAEWPEWAQRREWPTVRGDQRMFTPSRMGLTAKTPRKATAEDAESAERS